MKKLFCAIIITMAGLCAYADAVVSAAGSLESVVNKDATELTISGTLNAADLYFIATEMGSLTALDLSGAEIVSYFGPKIKGLDTYAANTIPSHFFSGSQLTSLVLPTTQGLSMGQGVFAGSALTVLTLPANLASLGSGCFTGCLSLTSVTIASNAPATTTGTFAGCENLAKVTFESAIGVGASMFSECTALTTIENSTNITSIGTRAFYGCTALQNITLGSALTSIGSEAFAHTGLTSVDLSGCTALQEVGDWAFAYNTALKDVNMGSAKTIGEGVLFECTALEAVSASSEATSVAAYSFTNDTALTGATLLSDHVTEIGNYALSGASGITEITLPSATEYIGDNAMERMTGLTVITLEQEIVPELGENVWAEVTQADVDLRVPENATEAYKATAQWQEFNIKAYSDTTDSIEIDSDYSVAAKFDYDNLIVRAVGIDITSVTLFDVSGTLLTKVDAVNNSVIIDTADFDAAVFIVTVTTTDGASSSLKIAKI